MQHDAHNQEDRAATYRANGEMLRQIAIKMRFDVCRRQQLLALADAFDRLADSLEQATIKEAAD
jgi:hypothetical protein